MDSRQDLGLHVETTLQVLQDNFFVGHAPTFKKNQKMAHGVLLMHTQFYIFMEPSTSLPLVHQNSATSRIFFGNIEGASLM